MIEGRRLTAGEVSARWGGKPTKETLAQWRYLGKGPAYIKLGKLVLYPLESVLEFERANTRTSTGAA